MISDYERGRRTYSDAMAKRLSRTRKVNALGKDGAIIGFMESTVFTLGGAGCRYGIQGTKVA